MDEASRKKLAELVVKDLNVLTDYEKEFLRARCFYLTPSEVEKFKSILSLPVAPEKEDEGEGKMTLADLKERAEKVGLKYKVGTKKSNFLKQIEEAEKL